MTTLISPTSRSFVAGHRGIAGSAICRALQGAGYGTPIQGWIPGELIEVQNGSHLGEDDIVSFEDRYGQTALSVRR